MDKIFLFSIVYTVITASSCKEQLVQTYVRIKMKLNSGTSIETVVTELSMTFYDLLHELEKAQKSKHNEIKIILYQNKNKWKNDVNKVKMKYN